MASTTLPATPLSLLSSELQGLHSNITIYYDNLTGSMPSLRQLAARIVAHTLLRH